MRQVARMSRLRPINDEVFHSKGDVIATTNNVTPHPFTRNYRQSELKLRESFLNMDHLLLNGDLATD